MKTLNVNEYDLASVLVEMRDFKYTEFVTDGWKDDHKFIFIFKDGDEVILSYEEFLECPKLNIEGCLKYHPLIMV
jgi:hypothetical protein